MVGTSSPEDGKGEDDDRKEIKDRQITPAYGKVARPGLSLPCGLIRRSYELSNYLTAIF